MLFRGGEKMKYPSRPAMQVYAASALVCGAITAAVWMLLVAPALQRRHERSDLSLQWLDPRRQIGELPTRMLNDRRLALRTRDAIEHDGIQLSPISRLNKRLAMLNEIAAANGILLDEV